MNIVYLPSVKGSKFFSMKKIPFKKGHIVQVSKQEITKVVSLDKK